MEFYTNVQRYGSNVLYRGYKDGQRVHEKIRFKPTLYLQNPSGVTGKAVWHSLDGVPVDPMVFESMGDANDFVKRYDGVKSFKIHGNQRYIYQLIQQRFPGDIHFDRNQINVSTLDIEVYSDAGFPEPDEAAHEITALTVKNNQDGIFHIWGCKPYDSDASLFAGKIDYRQFVNEKAMLLDFINWWAHPSNTPDIITGWNSRLFDIPYLVNRIENLVGAEVAQRLSPWEKIDRSFITIRGQKLKTVDIAGISQLDYMDLFQKFTAHTYGQQESYKLGHIAFVVLEDTKLSYDEYGSLGDLYLQNFQKYIDYNIKDVDIVDRLEDKLGLITLALTLAYMAGVNYSDTLGTTTIWDTLIFRDLARKAVAVPPSKENIKTAFPGGYVKDVKVGLHNWVCSFDLNSLYPNLIVQYNMSPETVLPTGAANVHPDIILAGHEAIQETPGAIVAANGAQFRSDKQGVLPRIVSDIYDRRVRLKTEMLKLEKQLQTMDPKAQSAEIEVMERDVSRLENQQTAIKILMNSLYGAMGNAYFRYFDLRVAEGVTLSGQLAIRWAEKAVNQYLNKACETTDVDYVLAIDTDSLYVSMEGVVNKFNPKQPVEFLNEFCAKGMTPVLNKAYDKLAKVMHCPKNRMGMKREVIADRGIWTAKKHYILHVHDKEGVRYQTPKIKIMGIEAVKSSTPAICRDALKSMFSTIMTKTEADAQQQIREFREKFNAAPVEDIARPSGCNNLSDYAAASTIYKKGTPMHVRAALLFNHYLKAGGLDRKYQLIQSGEKIKYICLLEPNPIHENVVAFMDIFPKELNLHQYVDRDTQFEKTFLSPIQSILDAIGWKVETTASLEDFFS